MSSSIILGYPDIGDICVYIYVLMCYGEPLHMAQDDCDLMYMLIMVHMYDCVEIIYLNDQNTCIYCGLHK